MIDVYRLRIAIHMFEIVKFNMYSSISAALTLEYPSHRYPTSSRDDLILPFPRTKSVKISYKYQFISIYSSVPPLNRLPRVKKMYTEHLISEYLYYILIYVSCTKALSSKWLGLYII